MPTIKYTFADGTTSEIEVTEEIYALHEQLATEESRRSAFCAYTARGRGANT